MCARARTTEKNSPATASILWTSALVLVSHRSGVVALDRTELQRRRRLQVVDVIEVRDVREGLVLTLLEETHHAFRVHSGKELLEGANVGEGRDRGGQPDREHERGEERIPGTPHEWTKNWIIFCAEWFRSIRPRPEAG